MITRRELLRSTAALTFVWPGIARGAAATDRRYVLVILRGAADGLAVAAPYADPDYRRQRAGLALPAPGDDDGLLDLDGLFGLHPALATVHAEFARGRAALLHAIASPYRERSHFDGQDVLENGADGRGRLRDGWLNRALAALGDTQAAETAIAMTQVTPLVLRGPQPVTSWAPSLLPEADAATLERLADLYAEDEFLATRLAQALEAQQIAAGRDGMDGRRRRGGEAEQLKDAAAAAARFLTADRGPRIAVLEAGGWDTHANQGAAAGQLANRLAALDAALATLKHDLAGAWSDTVVTVVTEFGRTVRPNGTAGTDHGTAGAALVVGGAVRGGRVIADWPGLAAGALHEGRDLRPTADLRGLFKSVLVEHLGVPERFVETDVFPASRAAPRVRDLIRV